MVIRELTVQDLSFTDYTSRQQVEISAEQVMQRASMAKTANQFTYTAGSWMPNEYEGFAVLSMVSNNPGNAALSGELQRLQQQLIKDLDASAYFLLPKESFHQTIANTLSDNRFKENIVHAGKEEIYPSLVANAFRDIARTGSSALVGMNLIGLSTFGNAIGILGVFESEDAYNKITSFRKQFYENEMLKELDVKLTRPFIGHITLAYIERDLTPGERAKLAVVLNHINEDLKKNPLIFQISQTELRRYHHLAEFLSEDNYPVFHF